jgi:hypothetical protein
MLPCGRNKKQYVVFLQQNQGFSYRISSRIRGPGNNLNFASASADLLD